jgi:hypothetical protein
MSNEGIEQPAAEDTAAEYESELRLVAEKLVEPIRKEAVRDERDTLRELIEAGLTPTLALDYYMVELGPYESAEWAQIRDVPPQATWESTRKARRALGEGGGDAADE